MKQVLKLTHTVPEQILTKIGDVIASYALMEQSLVHLLTALLSPDEKISVAIAGEASMKQRCAMALSVYRLHFGEDDGYGRLADIIKRTDAAEVDRNQIAHSWWCGLGTFLDADFEEGDVVRIKVDAKRDDGLRWRRTTMDATEIEAIARKMDGTARDLLAFGTEHSGRCRRRFAQHLAATVPAEEIVAPPRKF